MPIFPSCLRRIVVDVDGTPYRPRRRIAVLNVGRALRCRSTVTEQVRVSPTLFQVTGSKGISSSRSAQRTHAGDTDRRSLFVNSGASNRNAVKIARSHRPQAVVVFDHAFHADSAHQSSPPASLTIGLRPFAPNLP